MRKLSSPDPFETGVPKGKGGNAATGPKPAGVVSGNLGARYDGKVGAAAGDVAEVLPLVTLDTVRTISVQLHSDSSLRDAPTTFQPPHADGWTRPYTFDARTSIPPIETDLVYTHSEVGTLGDPPDPWTHPALGYLPSAEYAAYFGGSVQPGADSAIIVSTTGEGTGDQAYDLLQELPELHTHVSLIWDGGSSSKRFEIIEMGGVGGGGPFGDHMTLHLNEISSTGAAPFPALGQPVTLQIETADPTPPVGKLYLSPSHEDPDFIMAHEEPLDFGAEGPLVDFINLNYLRLEWDGGFRQYDCGFRADNDYEAGLLRMGTLTLIAESGELPADGEPIYLVQLIPQGEETIYPNSAARARVTYRAGQTGEVSFDCDWCGAFQVHAQTIAIERVAWNPRPDADYVDQLVALRAALSLSGDAAKHGLQLTEPVAEVTASGGERTIVIPQFARRVSLLLKYGDGSSGDAPLAELFLAFATPHFGSLGFIDALSCRDALFNEGLPIPHGTHSIVLTNRSGDVVSMGLLFHLGL